MRRSAIAGSCDPLADLAGDEVAELLVGGLVHQHVAVVAEPDAEPALGVALLPERFALLGGDLGGLDALAVVEEPAVGLVAAAEQLQLGRLDLGLRVGVDRGVVQRRAPVGRALEHGEVTGGLRDLLDHLHAGGARADDAHPQPRHVEPLGRPPCRVERRTREVVHPLEAGEHGDGQHADGGEEPARRGDEAVVAGDLPRARVVVPPGGHHAGVEPDVAPQVEAVGHVLEVPERLGLRAEVLGPRPLVEQLGRERVAVRVALGVEPRARVPVPVPGATDVGAGLETEGRQAELAEAEELVEARHAGADDDGVVLCGFGRHRPSMIDRAAGDAPRRG